MNERKQDYPLEVTVNRKIERITLVKLLKDLSEIFNLERGIFFLVKELILRPGVTIRSYLYENRYTYFHPIRLLLITTALNFFIFWLVDGVENLSQTVDISPPTGTGLDDAAGMKLYQTVFADIFNDYFNMMIWLFIPVVSLFSYWLFKKSGYNYAENLVLNTYVTCIGNILNTISYSFVIFVDIAKATMIGSVALIIYNVIVYHRFFRYKGASLVRGIVTLLLAYTIYILVFSFVIGIFAGFTVAKMSA
ncbi:MAG: DUF3667 domain-containing protein [Cyclobacteriaceae bacterium]